MRGLRAVSPEGSGSRPPPAGRGMVEEPRPAGWLMDGLARQGVGVEGDVDTFNLRSSFLP